MFCFVSFPLSHSLALFANNQQHSGWVERCFSLAHPTIITFQIAKKIKSSNEVVALNVRINTRLYAWWLSLRKRERDRESFESLKNVKTYANVGLGFNYHIFLLFSLFHWIDCDLFSVDLRHILIQVKFWWRLNGWNNRKNALQSFRSFWFFFFFHEVNLNCGLRLKPQSFHFIWSIRI